MTRSLTLRQALQEIGYDLLNVYRDPRAGSRVRVKVVIGKTGGPVTGFPTAEELLDVDDVVKEFLPEPTTWRYGRVYTSTIPKGTKLHLGTPSLVLEKAQQRRQFKWKVRVLNAARGCKNLDKVDPEDWINR